MRQKEFCEVSTPPNFIAFCFENQTPEIETVTVLNPQASTELSKSPRNADSEPDINDYAEAKIQSMEVEKLTAHEKLATITVEEEMRLLEVDETKRGLQSVTSVRSSTPIPGGDEGASNTSLTALESALRVAITAGSQLPKFLSSTHQDTEGSPTNVVQTDDDDHESSVYEVPALPSTEPKVRFSTDLCEGEKTVEEVSNIGCLPLCGSILSVSESGTEAGDETDSRITTQHHQRLIATSSRTTDTTCLNCLVGHESFSRRTLRIPTPSNYPESIQAWPLQSH